MTPEHRDLQTRDLQTRQAQEPKEQGPKKIEELISSIISLSPLKVPDLLNSPENAKALVPTGQIRQMIDAGRIDEGLQAARNLYENTKATFSPNTRLTVLALANLLEYATRVRRPQPDLADAVRGLEKHWNPNSGRDDSVDDTGPVKASTLGLHSAADQAPQGPPSYVMHTLPRVCEYAAQCGRSDAGLRDLAERSLKDLHRLYPLYMPAQETAETATVKKYAASAALRSAAHVVNWELREDRSDVRWIEYVARCSRERLEVFSPPHATLYHGIFQLESGRKEAGLEALTSLVSAPYNMDTDARIAALDQLTGWRLRMKEFDQARISLAALREALERDSKDGTSAMKDNIRVRSEELLRLRFYENTLGMSRPE